MKQAVETLKEVRVRMVVYKNVLLLNDDIVAATKANDAATLKSVAVSEFKALKVVDVVVASLKMTDAKGIVVIEDTDRTVKVTTKASCRRSRPP